MSKAFTHVHGSRNPTIPMLHPPLADQTKCRILGSHKSHSVALYNNVDKWRIPLAKPL